MWDIVCIKELHTYSICFVINYFIISMCYSSCFQMFFSLYFLLSVARLSSNFQNFISSSIVQIMLNYFFWLPSFLFLLSELNWCVKSTEGVNQWWFDIRISISIRYWYDILKILQYRYFKNNKYVNLMQAQEQDINVQQGSLLFVDNKMSHWT